MFYITDSVLCSRCFGYNARRKNIILNYCCDYFQFLPLKLMLKLNIYIFLVVKASPACLFQKEEMKEYLNQYDFVNMCMLSCFSHVQLFGTLGTITCQAPLSMGFSRKECWSGLPCLPPGHLPNPGIERFSYVSCIGRQAGSLPLAPFKKPWHEF